MFIHLFQLTAPGRLTLASGSGSPVRLPFHQLCVYDILILCDPFCDSIYTPYLCWGFQVPDPYLWYSYPFPLYLHSYLFLYRVFPFGIALLTLTLSFVRGSTDVHWDWHLLQHSVCPCHLKELCTNWIVRGEDMVSCCLVLQTMKIQRPELFCHLLNFRFPSHIFLPPYRRFQALLTAPMSVIAKLRCQNGTEAPNIAWSHLWVILLVKTSIGLQPFRNTSIVGDV